MSVKERIINELKIRRDNYIIYQVQHARIPDFPEDNIKRYKVLFKGRVQKVGLRLQVQKLAERLEITGYCENLENGDVVAELQGQENRIRFLLSYMVHLKRIKMTDKKAKHIPVKTGETGFEKR